MTIPLGFATGSNLTDLGRNLVAQEQTRNALQAALAAAAAQQGVARTQAGASRYSTDAQREGNQLMAMLRGLENDRLREATGIEAGLKQRDLDLRKFIGEQQFAPNTPAERDLDRKARIREAEIIAESQKAYNNRTDPKYASTLLEINREIDEIVKALPGLEVMANFESDALFNSRSHLLKNDAREKSDYHTKAFAITAEPNKYGTVGKYLVPTIMPDGRVRFKANPPSLLPVPGASNQPPPPTLPPVPTARLSVGGEFESDLSGPLDYVNLPVPNVPRGTPPPTIQNLPVTPDTEPGFFSRLGRALTGPDALPIPPTDPGFLSTRTAGGPPSPFSIVIEGSPFPNFWDLIRKKKETLKASPSEFERVIREYIGFLLDNTKSQDGARSAVAVRELARVRGVLGQ